MPGHLEVGMVKNARPPRGALRTGVSSAYLEGPGGGTEYEVRRRHRGTNVTTRSLPRDGYSRASESAGGGTIGAPASGPMAVLLGESPEIAAVRETVQRLVARQADARRLSPI